LKRRTWLTKAAALVLLTLVGPASAGSYLSRAAMLVEAAELEGSALRRRLHDKDLARLTHRLALSRVEGAREMPVPKEVVRAHPHLLLVLEAYERAADAALRGADESFLVALARAREERRTFEAVLEQLGWNLKSA
jgi:hypothetical protein